MEVSPCVVRYARYHSDALYQQSSTGFHFVRYAYRVLPKGYSCILAFLYSPKQI